jgi:hypothetical protein
VRHHENVGLIFDEFMEQANTCKKVGFDGFIVTEHHQQKDA